MDTAFEIYEMDDHFCIVEIKMDSFGDVVKETEFFIEKFRFERCVGIDVLLGHTDPKEDEGFMDLLQELKEL